MQTGLVLYWWQMLITFVSKYPTEQTIMWLNKQLNVHLHVMVMYTNCYIVKISICVLFLNVYNQSKIRATRCENKYSKYKLLEK